MSSKSPIRLKKSPSIKGKKNGNGGIKTENKIFHNRCPFKINNIHDYKHLSGIVKYGFLCYSEKEILKNRR